MNSIPVDLSRLTGLMCVSAPEAKTAPDGEVRTDRDGNTLYLTGISLRRAGTRKAFVIDVQTATEPVGVHEGMRVRIEDLDVSLWQPLIEDRGFVPWLVNQPGEQVRSCAHEQML